MGSIKDNNYTEKEWTSSNFSRAFSHPARQRIIELIIETPVSNLELTEILNLNKKTIKDHLDKISDADLIRYSYLPHFYMISVNKKMLGVIKQQLDITALIPKTESVRFIR